jgi:hypothetical protein
MTADPNTLRFFVDETSLGLGKALTIARKDVIHTGHPLIPEVPLASDDTVWIPAVAKRGLIAIGRDKHIRTRPGEVALLREHSLRVFRLAGKRDLSNWAYLVRMVRRWDELEQIVVERGPGPWFMRIYDNRITEVPLPTLR